MRLDTDTNAVMAEKMRKEKLRQNMQQTIDRQAEKIIRLENELRRREQEEG